LVFSLMSVLCTVASAEVLLQQSDLKYVGAFRLPGGQYGCADDTNCSFHYSLGPLGYNPANNTLFMAGHIYNQWIAEINIPTLVNSTSLNSLNTATIRQNFADLSAGKRNSIEPVNGGVLGGILMSGSKLVISDYAYYDGSSSATYTHFTANANWTANGVGSSGMKTVGVPPAPQAGFVGGYMAHIPAAWQSPLGGTALTGMSNIAITSRTSLGPSSFSFDPTQVGVVNPAPATAMTRPARDASAVFSVDSMPPNSSA